MSPNNQLDEADIESSRMLLGNQPEASSPESSQVLSKLHPISNMLHEKLSTLVTLAQQAQRGFKV